MNKLLFHSQVTHKEMIIIPYSEIQSMIIFINNL